MKVGIRDEVGGKMVYLMAPERANNGKPFVDLTKDQVVRRLLGIRKLDAICIKPKKEANALAIKVGPGFREIKGLSTALWAIGTIYGCKVQPSYLVTNRVMDEIRELENQKKVCPR